MEKSLKQKKAEKNLKLKIVENFSDSYFSNFFFQFQSHFCSKLYGSNVAP